LVRSEKKTGTLKGTAEDIVELSQSAQTARTRMRLRRRRRMHAGQSKAGRDGPRCNAASADEPPRLPKGFKPDGE